MTASVHVAPTRIESVPRAAPFPRVLLGIDFGPASLSAARWAVANVALHAELILAHVMPMPNRDGFDGDDIERLEALREIRLGIAGGLGGFAATLDAASTKRLVRLGTPSRWLSMIANDTETSLVVLGRRADANRTRVGEPNVIERVARRTSASVRSSIRRRCPRDSPCVSGAGSSGLRARTTCSAAIAPT